MKIFAESQKDKGNITPQETLSHYLLRLEVICERMINRRVSRIDKDSDRQTRETGYYPMMPIIVSESLARLERKGKIKPGANFLDMGCGFGLNTVMAASMGMNAYGIEVNSALAEGAKEILAHCKRRKKIDPASICKIVEGNYFPEEYRELRQKGESIAIRYEKELYKAEDKAWKSSTFKPQIYFYPKTDNRDAYKELGMSLKDIDVMYSYCWAINVPSIFEIFSRYTKKDAILIIESAGMPRDIDGLLESLGLDYTRGDRSYNPDESPLGIVTKK